MSATKSFLLRAAQVAAALAALSSAGASLAAEVEAKKDLDIYTEASNKSAVVGQLKTGEALAAVERAGMYWQVTTKDGKKGFVSVLLVKHKADADADLTKAIKSVVKQGRADDDSNDGRQRSAVMGVRGLAEDDDMANAGQVRPNLRAVYAMEDITVPEAKVKALGDDVFEEIAEKAAKKN
jgi:uncharacterized protein YgiM (DUF1202 family)